MTNKEKLSQKQFLLILNGPSCGGKSNVSNILTERYGGIYNAKSDAIKWFISDYNPHVHRTAVYEMTLETIRVALKHGLSVIKEGALYKPEKLIQIAQEYSIPVFIANVSAPKDVLEERFQERIESKEKNQNAKIANVDPHRFNELYEMYIETKMESPLEFDSSKQTAEEITDNIVSYIRSND